MLLKYLAIALVVPPVSLAFLSLFGLLVGQRWRRLGRLMVWVAAVGLLVLATPVVSLWLLLTLEQDLPLVPPPDQPPQAIVILGGDIRRESARSPIPVAGPLSLERVRAGALLARSTRLPVLITGGKVHVSDPPVAEVMADSLSHDFLVPVRWVEDASRDTWENAQLTAAILRENGISSVYMVTHAWHMRRAIVAFAAAGITVTAAPTRFDRPPPLFITDFIPGVDAWQTSYFALHEWLGLAWYSLR